MRMRRRARMRARRRRQGRKEMIMYVGIRREKKKDNKKGYDRDQMAK